MSYSYLDVDTLTKEIDKCLSIIEDKAAEMEMTQDIPMRSKELLLLGYATQHALFKALKAMLMSSAVRDTVPSIHHTYVPPPPSPPPWTVSTSSGPFTSSTSSLEALLKDTTSIVSYNISSDSYDVYDADGTCIGSITSELYNDLTKKETK